MPFALTADRMLTTYSKSVADVAAHTAGLIAENDALLLRQRAIAASLGSGQRRMRCLLCDSPLGDGRRFLHRGIPFAACGTCGHVQCAMLPPEGHAVSQPFDDIYRPLDPTAYRQRTERIYLPKLEWALHAGEALGFDDLLGRSWVELGSGAGNFVAALRQAKARRVVGLEAEASLVQQANRALGEPLVAQFSGSLAQAVRHHAADVYAAWFVFEHCFDLRELIVALSEKPAGTILVFAVPTFGLAALIESAFTMHYARSLDGVLHLQLFTERSIRYALDRAGYEPVAEWIFGQDADDLYRALMVQLTQCYPAEMAGEQAGRLRGALAGIQGAVDRARLADARHVLAVKT